MLYFTQYLVYSLIDLNAVYTWLLVKSPCAAVPLFFSGKSGGIQLCGIATLGVALVLKLPLWSSLKINEYQLRPWLLLTFHKHNQWDNGAYKAKLSHFVPLHSATYLAVSEEKINTKSCVTGLKTSDAEHSEDTTFTLSIFCCILDLIDMDKLHPPI